MNKLLFFCGLAAFTAVGFAMFLSCSNASSITVDDDVSPVDDDSSKLTCSDGYTQMYETCGFKFKDSDGNEIPLDQVIATCEADQSPYALGGGCGMCVIEDYDNCSTMGSCLQGCVSGGDDDDDATAA